MRAFVSGLMALGLAVFVSSCVTYELHPATLEGKTWKPAPSQVVARVEDKSVSVTATAEFGPEIRFVVEVTNQGTTDLSVNSDLFRVSAGAPGAWISTPLVTSDDYYARQEAWISRQVVTIVRDPMPAQTITTIGPGGPGSRVVIVRNQPAYQTRTVITGDPYAQQKLDSLRSQLFYSATIAPGQSHRGWVFAASSRGEGYELIVPINGKDYVLYFQKVRVKSSPFTNVAF